MAINNGYLYIGNASNQIALVERSWEPIPFYGKHKISINNTANFKVKNESTFFGAYSANSAVKTKAYNDLRAQVNNLGEDLRSKLYPQLMGWSYSDPQWLTYQALVQQKSNLNLGIALSRNKLLNSYSFNNVFKIYLQVYFNDSSLTANIIYPKVTMELSYV